MKGRRRAKNYGARFSGVEIKIGRLLFPERVSQPRYRSDCIDGPRPCPWIGCRYHLGWEVSESGSLVEMWPGDGPPQSCALDVADAGGHTLEEIGAVMGVTRERVRQIEDVALVKLRIGEGAGLR
jgi:hypothetical protein